MVGYLAFILTMIFMTLTVNPSWIKIIVWTIYAIWTLNDIYERRKRDGYDSR